MTKSSTPENAMENGEEANTQEQNTGSAQSSFNELLASGRTQSCTYAFKDEQGSQAGTVYFDGAQRMRGDFTIQAENAGTFDSHFIREGDWMYAWGGPTGSEMGTKINIAAQAQAEADQQSDTSADFDQRFDFDCDPWSVDRSKFELPQNVVFSEISAQFTGGMDADAGTGSSPGNQCSSCELLPEGEARNQCLQALGC